MTQPSDERGRPICGGKLRGEGRHGDGICHQAPGWRTNHVGFGHCALHLGATANHVVHAQRLAAEDAAKRLAIPRDIPAAQALAEEQARTLGWVDFLDAEVWRRGADQIVNENNQPSAFITMLGTERRHLVDVSRAIVSAGVEERRGAVLAEQAAAISRLARTVVALVLEVVDASPTAEQAQAIYAGVAREMRAIAASSSVAEPQPAVSPSRA
jgi:hypothetical protein